MSADGEVAIRRHLHFGYVSIEITFLWVSLDHSWFDSEPIIVTLTFQGKGMMNWSRLYGFKNYLKSSLWLVPFVAIPLELVTTRFLHRLDAWLGWSLLGFTQTGARALLEAFVTITLSFVVFTFGSLLVAIQVASAQLTPRLIATTLLRNRVVKYTVGLFIFTLMFALSAQNLMDKEVHQLVMLLATLLGICLVCCVLPSDRLRLAVAAPDQPSGPCRRRRDGRDRKRLSRSRSRC